MEIIGEGDFEWINILIQEEKFEIVVVCGGDGIVNFVVCVLFGMFVNMGILLLGFVNGFVIEFCIFGNVFKVFDVLLEG